MTSKHEGEFNDSSKVFHKFNTLRNHITQSIKTPTYRFKLKGDMMIRYPIKRNRYIKGQILEYTIIYILHFLGVFKRNTTVGLGADFWNDRFLIEAKHWAKRYSRGYSLTPARFLSEVLARFLESDPNHRKLWILITSAGINETTLKLLQAHNIQVITIKVITDDQTLQQAKQSIIKQLRRVLNIHTLNTFVEVVEGAGVGGVEGAVGEVVDVDGVVDVYVREEFASCAPLMRGFCRLNPDFLPVNPHTALDNPHMDVYNPYVEDYRQYIACDLNHIRMRNMLIMKRMLEMGED